MTDFVHLHVHTDFSLLDGASSVSTLIARAKSLGMNSLAITDHGNLFGVLKFYKEAKAEGIVPIIGSEMYMAPASRFEKAGSEKGNKYFHFVLLARNEVGYRNLMRLSSYSYTEGFYYKPRIDEELLERYADGLIGLSACLAGEIPNLILNENLEAAAARARRFRDILGDGNFYLELQDHGIPEQKIVNRGLVVVAERTGIPLVATNDLHYAESGDFVAQDILLCISTNKKRDDADRLRFENDQFYLKSGDEMAALFPDNPDAIINSRRIADRCRLTIPQPGPLLPDFELPAGFTDADDYLRHLAYDGLTRRYAELSPVIRERADYELSVIAKMGFVGYFLIVADFINWAKERDIPVGPGRGSGAGSIVAYALRITDIDPLRYNLLFERFLNPERISMPDFDVDFCYERRNEVIDYVTKKYGDDRVGGIITFGTLKAKAVIKDVARALDIPFEDANRVAALVPEDPKMTLAKAFEQESRLKTLEKDPKYTELFAIARKLENKNRHTSFHAAGIVIGKTVLTDYVPLYKDAKTGGVATQFTMDQIEDCGLVKMDFLGLKTLTLIKNTENLIKKRGGAWADFNVETASESDEATYNLLGEGKSTGIFQFESQGMQGILKQAKPNRIEDLIALNALYRPGPMAYIPQFIDCKWGRRPIEYPDASLKTILEETYGVIVYQEQVMQVAQIIAGYSLGQADLLRRAMGKKKADVMIKEKSKFIAGAIARGYSQADADRIFEILIPFAGYGFNKSHAAVYAIIAYRTAYLKTHFPAEFMAANLTNEIASTDKLPEYIDEARKMGIPLDPPDVNRSEKRFTVVDGRIVYGLLGIKGVGENAAAEIVGGRESSGGYRDFIDFLDRTDGRQVGKKLIETLIQTGAFDAFGKTRSTLLGNLERAFDYAQAKKADRKLGQSSLFEEAGEKEFPDFSYEELPDWDQTEKLRIEKELLGFYFSGHPMDKYRKAWERSVSLDLGHPDRGTKAREYVLVGIIKTLRPYQTKNGKWMAFGTLGDYNGEIDLVFFAGVWEKCRDSLKLDQIVGLRGKLDNDKEKDRASLLVDAIVDPDQLAEKAYRELHIRLDGEALETEETLHPLRDFLFEQAGACSVLLHIPDHAKDTIVRAASQITVKADEYILDMVASFPGVQEVWRE